MKIIPAIDIIEGKCVRLTKGNYNTKKVYSKNPVEVAKEFQDAGIKHLHLVDLDGAKSKHIVNYKVLEEIVAETDLKIDFGGGIKSDKDAEIAFESGVNQITGGSIAVKNPEIFINWMKIYGADKIILSADCKNRKIVTQGWTETSVIEVTEFITNYEKTGIIHVICTDVAKDGMLSGTSNELYREILEKTTVHLIASGGIATIEDVYKIKDLGCKGVIIGKAIYENKINLKDLEKFIISQ